MSVLLAVTLHGGFTLAPSMAQRPNVRMRMHAAARVDEYCMPPGRPGRPGMTAAPALEHQKEHG